MKREIVHVRKKKGAVSYDEAISFQDGLPIVLPLQDRNTIEYGRNPHSHE